MRVREIRLESEFEDLRTGWGTLCAVASKPIFLTWEWITAWWSAYGSPGDLRIATVFDDGGILRGIAPLRAASFSRYGQRVRALDFIGDAPHDSDSDYLDFIIEPGYEKPVMHALLAHWGPELSSGTVLELREMPAASPNLPVLKEVAQSGKLIWTEQDVPCAAVRLPNEWTDYLRKLQPRFRTKIRSVLKNLEGRREVSFGLCRSAAEFEELLPALFDLHTRRWAQAGKPGVFGYSQKRDFYRVLSPLLLDRKWLRLSWLKWNGRILACQYGFVYNRTYSQLQEGYEPASEHLNVGVGLRAWSIRELIQEGVSEYDFLGGVSRHKTDWGAEVKQSKRIHVANRNGKNLLILRGPEWEKASRARVRKIIPESILAARGRSSERTNGNGTSGDGWLRRAAAATYMYSGMPALMRHFRDRYQVSIAPNGQISWQKRSEAAARIFYYHRVNDDGDPFFPSISTAQFESQMQYLARHYKIVSMSQLMDHLREGGSSGAVVGITFDDGYADNYHNAFPILERYRIPATIFLTTGNLDSGERLWFEQLAEALKKTTREYIDVEIDIPRRLWTRTQEERLASNERIFELLRVLEDSERRAQLAEILKQLGPVACDRKNRMLTWDQVRFMGMNRIEFGGHTVNHPFLSRLTPENAAWEISECKRRIEEEVEGPVDYFAYPNGREQDLGAGSKELLRAAGYRGAVTTIWGMNYRSTDPMELRRGGPWESSPALFASKLDWYQMANQ